MNRLLLAGNVLLALFLVFRLVSLGTVAAAEEREWTVADMRVVVDDGKHSPLAQLAGMDGEPALVVDLGTDLPGFDGNRQPLDLGLRLEPMRDFVCYQISPRQLRLVTSKPLPPARQFHLHFGRQLLAKDGRKLAAGAVLAFETGRQFVRSVHVEDGDAANAWPTLVLRFGYDVTLAAVRDCVSLVGKDGPVACSCEPMPGDGASFRLLPTAALPDEIEVVVAPKLVPDGGELPMIGGVRKRVAVYEPLELRGTMAAAGRIDLEFNRGVPLPEPGLLQVEPTVPFQVLRRSGGLRLVGEFAAGTVWSVRLGDGFPGAGRVRLRHATVRSVLVPDRRSELGLAQSGSVLSSKALPQLLIKGVNVDEVAVRLRPVYTNNVVRLLQHRDDMVFAPAEVHRIAVHQPRNQEFTERLDLPTLLGGRAHGIYQVDVWDGKGRLYPRQRLLQVTDLGVSVRAAADAVAVQVVGIAGGEAVAAAAVDVVSPTNQVLCSGVTDAEGVALLRWPSPAADRSAFLVHVHTADDEVFVDLQGYGVELADESLGGRPFLQGGCEAFVWPTRGIVRPGERLDAAVVLRDAKGGAVVDRDLTISFVNPAGKVWRTQHRRSGGSGMLDVGLELGSDAPTGAWKIQVGADDQLVGAAGITVEAFVPNRLEASIVEVPPLRLGSSASVRVHGNWLEGSPAAGRAVQLRTRLLAGKFRAGGFEDYSFAGNPGLVPPGELDVLRGTLDEQGDAEIVVAMPEQARQQVLSAQFALELLDPSGRAVHAAATAVVLRPEFQLGVRAVGQTADVCVVDAGGVLLPREVPVTLRLERRTWRWQYESAGESRWRWAPSQQSEVLGEWHQITLGGRASQALPVTPGDGWLTVVASSGDQEVEQDLGQPVPRPDRLRVAGPATRVAPGAAAAITVTAPAPGRGFVTLETATIVSTKVVALQAGDNHIDVALPADLRVPNAHVVVTFTAPALAAKPGEGPPWLIGGASVALQRDDCAAVVTLQAPAQVLPESEVGCAVQAPGATRALVALVDVGVLQITEHQDPDPLAFFLAARRLAGYGADTGAHLLQGMTFAPGSKTGGDGDESGMALGGSISPTIRPLAMCREVDLDADGNGRASFQLPVYEGRVRWLVVAAGPAVVGAAAAPTVVKAPLGLQLAGPRMLAPGDRCFVPVTLRNDTGQAGMVQLQWQVVDGLELRTQPPRQIAVADGAVASFDVEVTALVPTPGRTPRLVVTAGLGQHQRQVAQEILVRSPNVFATDYTGIALGAAQDIALPADWEAGDLQLSLRLSSHPDQHLRPALQALLSYPYGCVEQTTSKGMALLACQALLPRILGDEAGTVQASALVQAAVDRLFAMQHWNGGFAWWPGSDGEYPFGTVYATDFLLSARAAGAEVPERALQQAVDRLVAIAADAGDLSLRCHAIEVLSRAGRPVQPRLDWLCGCEISAEDRVLLATALARIGDSPRALAMLQDDGDGDGAAVGPRDQGGLLRSPLRLQALRFRALFAADPASPRLPEQALLLQRAVLHPERLTTQEQAQVLRALADYFRVQPPAAAPRLSGSFAGEPLPAAVDGVVALPARPGGVLHLDAGGSGFALFTVRGFRPLPMPAPGPDTALRYRFVDPDTGAEVQRLQRGRVYDVAISGQIRESLANVVITNLLPGGVEAELPHQGAVVPDQELRDLLQPSCIERRDDRVLLFVAPELPRSFTLLHRVRAVFPGNFECPPLLAQAMYVPGSDLAGGAMPRLEILP